MICYSSYAGENGGIPAAGCLDSPTTHPFVRGSQPVGAGCEGTGRDVLGMCQMT